MMSNYSNVLYMFCAMLFILTVTNSVGGAIRYQENFLDEVFDIIDNISYENEQIKGFSEDTMNDYKQLDLEPIVEEEENEILKKEIIQVEQDNFREEELLLAEENKIKEEQKLLEESHQSQHMEQIEGFSGDAWAAW